MTGSRVPVTAPYLPMQPGLLARYLSLLGVRHREPGLAALTELVQAHLCSVPFENISKLYHRQHLGLRTLPGLELFLEGIERHNFGGTCYTNNHYFHRLLVNLGYEAKLCGADMSAPDVHLVSIVDVEDRQYIVDVGYAAPFFAPLPRDLEADHVIEWGNDRYVLKPQDEKGRSHLEFYLDGKLKHGYIANPAPRQIEAFEQVIADSYTDGGTFINAILLARFDPGRSVVVHNLEVTETEGIDASRRMLASRDELVELVAERFGIAPGFTMDALEELGPLENVWNGAPGSR